MKSFNTALKYEMERIAQLKVEEVLPFTVSDKRDPNAEREFFGKKVKMFSLRYQTFLKSLKCCNCGIVGNVMALERNLSDSSGRFHFNLYAVTPDGTEVLMTKDHILPKSKGGKDHIDNMRTMCKICNEMKDNDNKFIS